MRLSHGLRAALAGQAGGGVTDPYFSDVSLLLHGDGTNGSTTFVDSSSNNFTVTPSGNAQISTAQSKFGGASMAFDGSGDWLTVPRSTNFSFGTSDFTIEGWINMPTVGGGTYFSILSIGPSVQIYAISGTVSAYFSNTDSTPYVISNLTGPASALTANTWAHFAVTRSGSSFRTFVNGISGVVQTTASEVFYSSWQPAIGVYLPSSALLFVGYIDDFRITKGVARYTANFTPPTAAFLDA